MYTRAHALDDVCAFSASGSAAAHERLLAFVSLDDARVWFDLVSLMGEAPSAAILALVAQLIGARVRASWHSLPSAERSAFASALVAAFASSAPLQYAQSRDAHASVAERACTQLWASVLIRSEAAFLRASVVDLVRSTRLFDARPDAWSAPISFIEAPATAVSLVAACVEQAQRADSNAFPDERSHLEVRATLQPLVTELLAQTRAWFEMLDAAHLDVAALISAPLLRLLGASATIGVALGALHELGVLTAVVRAADSTRELLTEFCQFAAAARTTALPLPAPRLCALDPRRRDFAARLMHSLLDTLAECVCHGASTYPPHVAHIPAVDALLASCVRAHGLLHITSQLHAAALDSSTAAHAFFAEACEMSSALGGAVARLAAALGERETERVCSVDTPLDADLARAFVQVMIEATAHSSLDVCEEALEFWHCVQGIEVAERAVWALHATTIPVVRVLLTQLQRTVPLAAIAPFASPFGGEHDDNDNDDWQSDAERLKVREALCDTLAVLAPTCLADVLRELYGVMQSALSARSSGAGPSSWWQPLEACVAATRVLEPCVRQHELCLLTQTRESECTFWVAQLLGGACEALQPPAALHAAAPAHHPCAQVRALLAQHAHLWHQTPLCAVASVRSAAASIGAASPALVLSVVSLLSAYARWWARGAPLLPVPVATLDSAVAVGACAAVALQNASLCSASSAADETIASRFWASAVLNVTFGVLETVAECVLRCGAQSAPPPRQQQRRTLTLQCAAIVWSRTAHCLARQLGECGWAAAHVTSDLCVWVAARAHAVTARAAFGAVRVPYVRQVALPPPIGAAFQLHASASACIAPPTATTTTSHASFAIGAPLACHAALLAAAPVPNLEAVLSQFAATRAHLVRCVSARISALPVSAGALFVGAAEPDSSPVDASRACTDAVQCVADVLRPLAGIGAEFDETRRDQAAAVVSALIEPSAVLWQACCGSGDGRVDVDVALVTALCATVVGACRAVGSDARLVYSSLRAVCACATAILVALENAPSPAATLPRVDALAVSLDACAQLLDVCVFAPADAEMSVHAALRALPVAALVELMCRAAATALRFGAAGALAAAAHASSTAVALLVSAVARAHHRRRLAAHAPSADDETCVAEAARALQELCSVHATGGVACACACLRSMVGSEGASVASKAIAFCSAAIRLPRDLQMSMRVLELQSPASAQAESAAPLRAFADTLAFDAAAAVTHTLLSAMVFDWPQPEVSISAELAALWLEACSGVPTAEAAWPAWWRSFFATHAAVLQLHASPVSPVSPVDTIVAVAEARVADGRVRPWREFLLVASRVVRKACALDALSQFR